MCYLFKWKKNNFSRFFKYKEDKTGAINHTIQDQSYHSKIIHLGKCPEMG